MLTFGKIMTKAAEAASNKDIYLKVANIQIDLTRQLTRQHLQQNYSGTYGADTFIQYIKCNPAEGQ